MNISERKFVLLRKLFVGGQVNSRKFKRKSSDYILNIPYILNIFLIYSIVQVHEIIQIMK